MILINPLKIFRNIWEVRESSVILLNIELDHLRINACLPFHHRDPFDRLIIAQSIAENLPILTVDSFFNQYPIRLVESSSLAMILRFILQPLSTPSRKSRREG